MYPLEKRPLTCESSQNWGHEQEHFPSCAADQGVLLWHFNWDLECACIADVPAVLSESLLALSCNLGIENSFWSEAKLAIALAEQLVL